MKRFVHWFAAIWNLAIIGLACVLVVGAICFIAYFLWEHSETTFWLICAGLVVWLGPWSVGYIDRHGWPWKSDIK